MRRDEDVQSGLGPGEAAVPGEAAACGETALRRALPVGAVMVDVSVPGDGVSRFLVSNVSASALRDSLSPFMVQESWTSPGWFRVGIGRAPEMEMVEVVTAFENVGEHQMIKSPEHH